jgi:hypothetical protein
MVRAGGSTETACYSIRVGGRLDDRWSAWFGGLALAYEPDGTTTLTGPVVDQAELYGLLLKVRDLGLPLLAVAVVDA